MTLLMTGYGLLGERIHTVSDVEVILDTTDESVLKNGIGSGTFSELLLGPMVAPYIADQTSVEHMLYCTR